MRFIFSIDPERVEHIVKRVHEVAPSCKHELLEAPKMWPELSLDFGWLDLDAVVAVLHRAHERLPGR